MFHSHLRHVIEVLEVSRRVPHTLQPRCEVMHPQEMHQPVQVSCFQQASMVVNIDQVKQPVDADVHDAIVGDGTGGKKITQPITFICYVLYVHCCKDA